jgi:hypothetical protein
VVEGQRSSRMQSGVSRSSATWLVASGVLASESWACTAYEPASDRLPIEQVGSLNPAVTANSDWSCLDPDAQAAPTPVAAGPAGRVIYSIQVVDLSTGQIHPDARVRACGFADINCENPVTNWLTVDAEGWVDVPLFRDFLGFFEVMASDTVPYLFYLAEPVRESTVEYPLGVVAVETLGPLVQLLGVPVEPENSVIAARAFNCDGDTATDVSLSTDGDGVPWYFVDGLPTSMGSGTGADGLAGLANVEPGLVVFDLRAPNGMSIGGPQSVVVRPNWLSAVYVRPPGGMRAFIR